MHGAPYDQDYLSQVSFIALLSSRSSMSVILIRLADSEFLKSIWSIGRIDFM
jgi:hypothetical protein